MSFSARVTEFSEGVRCTSTASDEAKHTIENGIVLISCNDTCTAVATHSITKQTARTIMTFHDNYISIIIAANSLINTREKYIREGSQTSVSL